MRRRRPRLRPALSARSTFEPAQTEHTCSRRHRLSLHADGLLFFRSHAPLPSTQLAVANNTTNPIFVLHHEPDQHRGHRTRLIHHSFAHLQFPPPIQISSSKRNPSSCAFAARPPCANERHPRDIPCSILESLLVISVFLLPWPSLIESRAAAESERGGRRRQGGRGKARVAGVRMSSLGGSAAHNAAPS